MLKRKGKENTTSNEQVTYRERDSLRHREKKRLETAKERSKCLAKAREH
ncbi:18200_t:CDS:1, partial [Racocetra fulgida]